MEHPNASGVRKMGTLSRSKFYSVRATRGISSVEANRKSQIMFPLAKMVEKLVCVPSHLNPVALRKAKIVYYFGLSEYSRVKATAKLGTVRIVFGHNLHKYIVGMSMMWTSDILKHFL